MKKLIVTIAIGEFHQKLAEFTHPFMAAYAEKVGADFCSMEDQGDHSIPHYRKLDLGEFLNDYDRILYVDTDIIIRPDAPDIFELVPPTKFGAFNEGAMIPERISTLGEFMTQNGFVAPPDTKDAYYNTGVMVFSKCHQPLFLQPEEEQKSFYEQTYLNLIFQALKAQMHDLPYRFNRMSMMNRITGEHRCDGYFIHYAGIGDTLGSEKLLELVESDIKLLKENPEYNFKRRIMIAVQGGMGDQVAAEPGIRYMRETLYPDAEIHLASQWPDLFDHLPEVRRYNKVADIKDINDMFICESYKDGGDDSWTVISQGAMHITDFSSIQLFKASLPFGRKQPKLVCAPSDILSVMEKADTTDFKNNVIIHPGKGWPSKTFPADIWESYVKALVDEGFRVIIFGKKINETQGVVDFKLPDSKLVVNLVDQLSLKEMIGLVSLAPILLSNESSPVHIAGAFDNWIGLFCTGKRPEFVIPYRGNPQSPFYKARALEKGRRYDLYQVKPTNVEAVTMDVATESQLREWLPDAETVSRFACWAQDGILEENDTSGYFS